MQNIINKIFEEKIITIVRGVAKEDLIPLAEAMYKGGIRLLEITYGKASDEETAENIAMLCKHFEGKMLIGAGTVLTKKQVELTKNAGGKFIISPDTNTEVIAYTKELGLISMPGAMTPSEIMTAYNAGADFVKLFPASAMGADYIKAIKAPLSHINLLAVGGVDLNNMEEYYNAGACGFGLGSNIVNHTLIKNKDYDAITKSAEAYVNKLKSIH